MYQSPRLAHSDFATTVPIAGGGDGLRNRTRTPRTPANNGILLSLGAGYSLNSAIELAFAYSHYFIDSARIDLRADAAGNAARGNLSGSSGNALDTLSLQLRWTF